MQSAEYVQKEMFNQTKGTHDKPHGQKCKIRIKELSEEDKQQLQRYWRTIKSSLSMRQIIDFLIEEGVISPDEWEGIDKNNASEMDKTHEFLLYLLKQPADAYGNFIKVLNKRNYSYLVEKLQRRSHSSIPIPSSGREGT
ncbi:hypothetical protein CHS0354_009000 [Potamilus streckersoni]|uniref:CARD domain-containing protein n=1 Tax=Potamilus streckersoni TaxID=2493646 RepID=A0AAE0TIG0_9BIVA|nr:hypothetical protein CHS0354_009000 [Potamilus streckersoni]